MAIENRLKWKSVNPLREKYFLSYKTEKHDMANVLEQKGLYLDYWMTVLLIETINLHFGRFLSFFYFQSSISNLQKPLHIICQE